LLNHSVLIGGTLLAVDDGREEPCNSATMVPWFIPCGCGLPIGLPTPLPDAIIRFCFCRLLHEGRKNKENKGIVKPYYKSHKTIACYVK